MQELSVRTLAKAALLVPQLTALRIPSFALQRACGSARFLFAFLLTALLSKRPLQRPQASFLADFSAQEFRGQGQEWAYGASKDTA